MVEVAEYYESLAPASRAGEFQGKFGRMPFILRGERLLETEKLKPSSSAGHFRYLVGGIEQSRLLGPDAVPLRLLARFTRLLAAVCFRRWPGTGNKTVILLFAGLDLLPLPGGACTHWKAPPCHGAHPKRPPIEWREAQ
jgi:hypothetical protein